MNFPNFPLYYSLKKDEFQELTENQKDEFVDMVKSMNDDQFEKVYALIRAYHLEHDSYHQLLPYGGKNLKSGLKFDFDCIPSKLQNILYSFSKLNK
jgi:hypothetical protein